MEPPAGGTGFRARGLNPFFLFLETWGSDSVPVKPIRAITGHLSYLTLRRDRRIGVSTLLRLTLENFSSASHVRMIST